MVPESYNTNPINLNVNNVPANYGRVLISGGYHREGETEIFDFSQGTSVDGPVMKQQRFGHASVALYSGDVALFGGRVDYNDSRKEYTCSCEVFSVNSLSFYEVGYMHKQRQNPAAVLLNNGVVFIVGGCRDRETFDCCELYTHYRQDFVLSAAKMKTPRVYHTASLLPDGRVLVCGGYPSITCYGSNQALQLNTTEIYDWTTDSFSDGPLMNEKRAEHTANTLPNGKVIIAGGNPVTSSTSTEIYDPATNSFSAGPTMTIGRSGHCSASLPDGKVFIVGGFGASDHATEVYDPATNTFSVGPELSDKRRFASATAF
jgi:hypothetical protein